jgi:hypothetical protein
MTRFARALMVLALMLVPFAAGAADKPSPAEAKPAARKTGKGKAAKKPHEAAPANSDARGKSARAPRPKVAGGLHPVSDVQVTPFPSHAAAAQKALAQNRRDSLESAERAARAEHQDDRWQTVLFNLREFDARSDAEACFWRVLAYYRLGEMARARSIRQLCTLGSKEEAALDTEDGLCGTLQPASAMPEMLAAGEHPPAPVPNPAPYAGAAPARLER